MQNVGTQNDMPYQLPQDQEKYRPLKEGRLQPKFDPEQTSMIAGAGTLQMDENVDNYYQEYNEDPPPFMPPFPS